MLSLNVKRIYTVVSYESTFEKIKKSRDKLKQKDRWVIHKLSRSKKYGMYRSEVRKIRSQLFSNATLPSTIIMDVGDFSTEYLRATMQIFSDSCVQYIIYNRRQTISNLGKLRQMMERQHFKQVKNVKSSYIATFVSESSPLWNKH